MKLLLIEDDAQIARDLVRGLTAEGFAVDHAADGIDGLWMATESRYDLIVLDILLPGKNGYQVCTELRAAENWTPILMLTAKDSESDEADGLDLGADDYLTKPFSFTVLVARLFALTRRRRGTTRATSALGDLRIDSATHQVWRADHEVRLTTREFAVLEFLMRRAGEVMSKAKILDGVWEYDFDGDPNIVEVYVRRIRTKIDVPFRRTTLQTVRGAGYRLAADDA